MLCLRPSCLRFMMYLYAQVACFHVAMHDLAMPLSSSGGVGICFNFASTSYLFVAAHFAAGQKQGTMVKSVGLRCGRWSSAQLSLRMWSFIQSASFSLCTHVPLQMPRVLRFAVENRNRDYARITKELSLVPSVADEKSEWER